MMTAERLPKILLSVSDLEDLYKLMLSGCNNKGRIILAGNRNKQTNKGTIMGSTLRIVILQRGWVVVGMYEEDGDALRIFEAVKKTSRMLEHPTRNLAVEAGISL